MTGRVKLWMGMRRPMKICKMDTTEKQYTIIKFFKKGKGRSERLRKSFEEGREVPGEMGRFSRKRTG